VSFLAVCNIERGILFADRYRMDHLVDSMGSGFRDRRGQWSTHEIVIAVLALVVLVLLVWLAIYLARRLIKHFRNGSLWLFLRICRAHGLTWPDRWMLWQLAVYQQLREPAYVFIDPECWEESRIDPRLFSRMARLSELRKRLFCDLPARQRARLGTPLVSAPAAPPVGAVTPAPRPALDLADWLGASQRSQGTLG
jgi:hypothetical protein